MISCEISNIKCHKIIFRIDLLMQGRTHSLKLLGDYTQITSRFEREFQSKDVARRI
jgi:hypothetical protein